VPGVDFAEVVERSKSGRFRAGDEVILTGWGVGEYHWGGLAEKAQVKSEWLVPLPKGMTLRQSMTHGSAGLSAMLCVNELEHHGIDKSREVLVTGASGGVGSVALMLLKQLGYRPIGSSGRPEHADYLKRIGAGRIVDRETIATMPATPLLSEQWGAVIDNVGGSTLANALASVAYGGAVASLGLVGGRDLSTTVMPFIMRAVALIGIDSVYCPTEKRITAWDRLSAVLPNGLPSAIVEEIGLDDVIERARLIVQGGVRGRIIVAL
jgi:acrylyl-CoA reductase (NADPH)